jgi:hypothetical protein
MPFSAAPRQRHPELLKEQPTNRAITSKKAPHEKSRGAFCFCPDYFL